MFHLYTDDARRVLSVAQRHARRLHCDAVGIEHLALALTEYGRGPAEEALFALNVTPSEAWAQWESLVRHNSVPDYVDEPRTLPYTPGASRVLNLSLDERRQLRHSYIGSEHLFLALLRHLDDPWAEPELASEFFERLGVDLRQLRQEILSRTPTDSDLPPSKHTKRIRGLGPLPQMDWWTGN